MAYKIGDRVHREVQVWTCGRCGQPRETLELTEVGWRCLNCLGESKTPEVLPLLSQLRVIAAPRIGTYKDMSLPNDCYYCHKRYKVDEVDDNGFAIHPTVCNECCKFCIHCNTYHMITHFLPIQGKAYNDWLASGAYGVFNGRENHAEVCRTVLKFWPKESEPKSEPTPVEPIDLSARIQALLTRVG